VRPEGGDLFGYGAREAVVRALTGDPADRAPFGSPASTEELSTVLTSVLGLRASHPDRDDESLTVTVPHAMARPLAALALAHGWTVHATDSPSDVRLRPDPH
jgi:coenzyme F420-0:L-glutamate ligase/coenzyme F420-1:gamma-L-glutamate ligase